MALTILLVDDEPLISDALQVLIQEIDSDFEIVGKIYDGQKAWEYIQMHQPDAVFLDIRMPKMDGFEVLEKITRYQYDTKVIILSAYRDFEYAQQAIRLGAIDYLAKPIEQESLKNALLKLKRLHARDLDMQQATTLHAVNNLLCGGETARKQFAQWKFFDDLPNEKIQVAIIQFEKPQQYSFYREYRKLSPEWKRCLRPLWYNAHFWIVIYKYAVLSQAPGVNIIRRSFSDQNIKMGFSEITEAAQFPAAFRQAINAVQHSFYDSGQQVFRAQEVKPFTQVASTNAEAELLRTKLLEKVRLSLADDAHTLLQDYFNMARSKRLHPEMVCEVMIAMLSYLHLHAKYLSGNQNEVVAEDIQWLRDLCEQGFYHTEEEVNDRVRSTLDIFLSNTKQSADLTDRSRVIRKVQQYCERNYKEEITLDMIVQEVHMTKSWFCSIFKKETGQSFGNYLIDLRMKKAQVLLETTELKVNQVAVEVGYKNVSHFNHTFVEKFGMTPMEYRRQNWNCTKG